MTTVFREGSEALRKLPHHNLNFVQLCPLHAFTFYALALAAGVTTLCALKLLGAFNITNAVWLAVSRRPRTNILWSDVGLYQGIFFLGVGAHVT